MIEQANHSISAALDNLANASDTLTGVERIRLGLIMQELSDFSGSRVDIEECLAEAAAQ